ncbi:MAPEG family protein [Pseudomonas sp. DB1]|uniref:MAPEG family protein n=1 Tax=Metapseudomonas boanensis TaxID=2822138 RepID=A0ABS5XJ89_9GAMM|nr:MAPEG family protein [Pseudomonas boanensis]
MTLANWCVFIALFLPYLSTATAKFSGGDFDPRQNHDPRTFLEELPGWRKRADYAQLNAFEVTSTFAAAVIIALFVVAA